ncbi:MAG: hypothetical protein ACKO5Q_25935, partial [Microcystaceae cyanobacterium]
METIPVEGINKFAANFEVLVRPKGFFKDAIDETGCELLGGDTTRGPLTISVTAFGEVAPDRALRRDRAMAQDDLWVSGALGGAALA